MAESQPYGYPDNEPRDHPSSPKMSLDSPFLDCTIVDSRTSLFDTSVSCRVRNKYMKTINIEFDELSLSVKKVDVLFQDKRNPEKGLMRYTYNVSTLLTKLFPGDGRVIVYAYCLFLPIIEHPSHTIFLVFTLLLVLFFCSHLTRALAKLFFWCAFQTQYNLKRRIVR